MKRKPKAKHWDVDILGINGEIVETFREKKWWDAKGRMGTIMLMYTASFVGTRIVLMRTSVDGVVTKHEEIEMRMNGWHYVIESSQRDVDTPKFFTSPGGQA